MTKREAERSKNMFALGLMSWLYHRPTDGHDRLPRAQVRVEADDRGGQRQGLQGRVGLRRDLRGLRRLLRGRARRDGAGHLPQHHGQPGARDGPDRCEREERAAALPRRLPDHARLGDPRAPLASQALRRAYLPGRGRDRGGGSRAGRELRRRARRLHLERPRGRPEERDRRARGRARAAAPDPRHPARGPLDRDADQARAGRSA